MHHWDKQKWLLDTLQYSLQQTVAARLNCVLLKEVGLVRVFMFFLFLFSKLSCTFVICCKINNNI